MNAKEKEIIRDWNGLLAKKIHAGENLVAEIGNPDFDARLEAFLRTTIELDKSLYARYQKMVDEDDVFEAMKAQAEAEV